ncbi:MAG: ornithine--oxo-acid transaminase [Deltaproteobacteria bacterium]|nr:ornithine--oxo-acid transaminase [Deltaproteobacteria bacterium]
MAAHGPDAKTLMEIADAYGSNNYRPLPVVIARGEGVFLYDVDDRRYMDMLSAYSAVSHGHSHPRMVRALSEQAARLCVTSRAFHSDQIGPFMKELCELTGMEKVLPMNTGAEAVETAVKAARKWGYVKKNIPAGQAEIIAFEGNFHGRTTTIVSFSSEELYKKYFAPFTPGFKIIPYGDAGALRDAVTDNTCAVLVEAIQGEAGVRVPPDGFLRDVRRLCDERNLLLMLDEIQTGLGRTGKMFCYEHDGIRPDVLILGKALGGGVLPISAAVSSAEVLGVFVPGEHGSTFGGNPLACACAREALRILVEDDLPGRAARLGGRLRSGLEAIKNDQIIDVRGKGLLLAVEFGPGERTARQYCEGLMAEGILAKETHGTTVRFAPPLVITEEQVDWALERITKVFAS